LRRLSHNHSPYIELILLEERERLIEREEKLREGVVVATSTYTSASSQTSASASTSQTQTSTEEYITQTIDLKRFTDSSGKHNILSINNKGKLIEMILVSDNNDYGVIIETESFKLDRTYSELSYISDYVDSISVFQDGSNYILSVYDIKFTKFDFYILINSKVTFSRIYAKWEELVKKE